MFGITPEQPIVLQIQQNYFLGSSLLVLKMWNVFDYDEFWLF
jgi:hypothetical protein